MIRDLATLARLRGERGAGAEAGGGHRLSPLHQLIRHPRDTMLAEACQMVAAKFYFVEESPDSTGQGSG